MILCEEMNFYMLKMGCVITMELLKFILGNFI